MLISNFISILPSRATHKRSFSRDDRASGFEKATAMETAAELQDRSVPGEADRLPATTTSRPDGSPPLAASVNNGVAEDPQERRDEQAPPARASSWAASLRMLRKISGLESTGEPDSRDRNEKLRFAKCKLSLQYQSALLPS